MGTCGRLLAAQFDRLCVLRLGHPESARFNQVVVFGRRKKTHLRGEPKGAEELLRIAYKPQLLPVLNQEVNERYAIPPSSPVTITYAGLPLDEIEDTLQRSVALQIFCCLRTRIPRAFTGKYPSLMQPALRIFPPKGWLNRTDSGEERAEEVRSFSVRFNKF